MWWWTKVRKADIIPALREKFELLGEHVIASAIASDPNPYVMGTIKNNALDVVYGHYDDAIAWLKERRDKQALREDRLETLEWALLILALMGFVAIIPTIAGETVSLISFLSLHR
jgi:hypothetical protein